jgi:hypothetical protein
MVGRIVPGIARQRRGKLVIAATDTDATVVDAVFSMWSVPRLYSEDQLDKKDRACS